MGPTLTLTLNPNPNPNPTPNPNPNPNPNPGQERLGVDETGASEAVRIRTEWLAEGGVAGVARHPELQTLLLDGNRATSLAG